MVEKFDLKLEPKLLKVVDALGYELRQPPPPYSRFEAAGEGVRITLYESGKLVIQGKRADEVRAELAAFELLGAAAAAAAAKAPAGALIGTDEAGKGDYFGPLVAAAVHVDERRWAELRELGVRDSKTIADAVVKKLALEVKRRCPWDVVAIGPAKYNELYEGKFRNVNKLLAWAHARAIENLLERCPDCPRVLTDQFASDVNVVKSALLERGRKVVYEQRPRAEEETAVAAASIVARAEFLEKLSDLSDRFGILLEKGASARVEACARAFVAKWGRERLGEVAKLHFQTTARVLAP
ncbi:MAG TPA: ribonuclease HIII [Planctomycetota bacterium]|nr:ribonuclease HIII [Planctomycetota bacterium]